MPVTVRFAPSPTGLLHIGNARAGLVNWLFAKKHGGRFILRFDDTDAARSRPEYVEAIREDLAWLGIVPDEVQFQSERLDVYRAAAERLRADGRLYPCYETAEELELRRKRQLARGEPPVYDRAALNLTEADRARLEAEGRRPYWRFKLARAPVHWDDLVRGPQSIDTATLSDPVLVRQDGTYLYTFTSVVDDADMGVTHVIRGEDHVVNTAVQLEIFDALGAPRPTFAHLSLLVGRDGEGLSKRLGSLSLRSLRESGLEPMAVVGMAALLGTSEPVRPHAAVEDLLAGFDLEKFSRAPARFDETELKALNARLLHGLGYEAVKSRLEELDADGGEAFWTAVRGNLATLAEARDWRSIVFGDVPSTADEADRALFGEAARLLPAEPWTRETWKEWTASVSSATGRKGKSLFMPLRRALTGRDHGPELAALLPLIGRERALARLSV